MLLNLRGCSFRHAQGRCRSRPRLTNTWNSGPVEVRVNHLKMIKRQMFGRASLALLRKRVLLNAVRH